MTAEEMLDKGKDYLYGFGEENKDYEKAIRYLFKALEAGSIEAISEIGCIYQYGRGVEKNKSKAVKWYRCGAELGDPSSMNELADCLLKGIGMGKNIDEAIQWFEKASQIEVINDLSDEYCKWDSMLKIAEIYISLKDETKALEWFET